MQEFSFRFKNQNEFYCVEEILATACCLPSFCFLHNSIMCRMSTWTWESQKQPWEYSQKYLLRDMRKTAKSPAASSWDIIFVDKSKICLELFFLRHTHTGAHTPHHHHHHHHHLKLAKTRYFLSRSLSFYTHTIIKLDPTIFEAHSLSNSLWF